MTTDTPTTAAEMREAAAQNLDLRADDIERDPLAFSGSRHQIARVLREEAATTRAIPLPSDDEMAERVARALCQNALAGKKCPCAESGVFRCGDSYPGSQARAAIAAMRGTDNGPEPAKGE